MDISWQCYISYLSGKKMFLYLSVTIFYSQEIQTISNAISYIDRDFNYKKTLLWKETTLFLKTEAKKKIHWQIDTVSPVLSLQLLDHPVKLLPAVSASVETLIWISLLPGKVKVHHLNNLLSCFPSEPLLSWTTAP